MSARSASAPRLADFRCEFLSNPLGLDEAAPRFSWKLADSRTGARQTAYRLQVAVAADASGGTANFDAAALVWDSGLVKSADSHLVPWGGPALAPHTRYVWRVTVHDHLGQPVTQNPAAGTPWFETGFLSTDEAAWQGARWISLDRPAPSGDELLPCPFLRKTFTLDAAPRSARLYLTARGLFEPHLNGQRIGRDVLAPGWTDYNKRIEYLAYDVTAALRAGDNALGAILGDGWYAGNLGWTQAPKHRHHYGAEPALLAALRIVRADGSVGWIVSDGTWRATTGPLLFSDLYHGESHDARRELAGWSEPARPGHFARGWTPVATPRLAPVLLNAKATPPVRVIEELPALAVTEPAPGRHTFDLGQNMVGVIRLRIRAPRGTKLTIRYAEMLQADGTVYTENLRSARATDTWIARGGPGIETWVPKFTFHGFRYVEITGLPGSGGGRGGRGDRQDRQDRQKKLPPPETVTGLVLHSDMPRTGDFTCSHPLVNRLQENIRWGQRGNFLDVPTDCPQRDERLGWTGDAQVFAPTAAFNYDVASFFRKWTRDLADDQDAEGAYPDVAPDVLASMYPGRKNGNAAWADAGVICPWVMYRHFGDTRILEENYPAMARWIGYQEKTSDGLLRPDTAYGDWLAPDATECSWAATPCDLIGTAYFAHTTALMARIARILQKTADARRFDALHAKIVRAFNRAYVTADGRLAGDAQTAYLLALAFDLLPAKLRPRAIAHLERCFARRGDRLSTGFVGTPLLGPVLSAVGRADLACTLLFNEAYPSWLFTVKNGATTMWERWNSWTPDKGFGEVGMNSFNHYAYGAIGEWLYSTVAGIALDPGVAAYREFRLQPHLDDRLAHAAATLESPWGRIASAWKRAAGGGRTLRWEVEIPANTRATALPPLPADAGLDTVQIDGKPWKQHPGASAADPVDGRPAIALAAGRYTITFAVPAVKKK
ncbi:alpha-L-rhamnosidase [Opitutaceae bacterium TAV1]|nr:alpha-L-rhamnosidase [Opitutaceae bacterium TAV1]